MLRPVPCSALSEPSYLRTTMRQTSSMKPAIAIHLRCIVEVLGENEVQVPLERVSEDDRLVVAVRRKQRLQVERGLREPRDRKRDVLDDDRGADVAHRAHRREHALAHVPVVRDLGRDRGEGDG